MRQQKGEVARHLLIVEDTAEIRTALNHLFISEGYTVQLAANGKEALDVLATSCELPKLILLDLMMPVMDGIQFRQEQQKDVRIAPIPVLLMSADANLVAKARSLRTQGYVKKPFDIEGIISTVGTFYV
jgi:CheY-like chemotaxis protein